MKQFGLALCAVIALSACNSRKAPQNLPKDVALKPAHEQQIDIDRENMKNLKAEIDSIAGSVACTDAAEWRISPLGSKPCGGPASYFAYPIKLEEEILPKVQEYTRQQSDFNRRNKLMSDCAITPMPSGIRCEDGKAVLIKSGSGNASVY